MHAAMHVTDQILAVGFSEEKAVSFLLMVSYVCWVATYGMVIYIGFKHKAVAVPMVSICLNVTWELLFGFVIPGVSDLQNLALGTVGTWGVRAELTFDAIVFYLLLRHGRKYVAYSTMRRYFPVLIGITVLLAYMGQHSFTTFYQDRHGLEGAFLSNFVMSVLFIMMYFARPNREGISHFIAWTKMLGTASVSISHLFFMRPWNPQSTIQSPEDSYPYPEFMLFLMISVFLLDCLYIWLTYPRRAANRAIAE